MARGSTPNNRRRRVPAGSDEPGESYWSENLRHGPRWANGPNPGILLGLPPFGAIIYLLFQVTERWSGTARTIANLVLLTIVVGTGVAIRILMRRRRRAEGGPG